MRSACSCQSRSYSAGRRFAPSTDRDHRIRRTPVISSHRHVSKRASRGMTSLSSRLHGVVIKKKVTIITISLRCLSLLCTFTFQVYKWCAKFYSFALASESANVLVLARIDDTQKILPSLLSVKIRDVRHRIQRIGLESMIQRDFSLVRIIKV